MTVFPVVLLGTDPRRVLGRMRTLEGFASVRVVAHGPVEEAANLIRREKPVLAIVEPSATSVDVAVISGIMVHDPLPIVVVQNPEHLVDGTRYLAAGALEVTSWPTAGDSDELVRFERRLRTLARVLTTTRRPPTRSSTDVGQEPVVAIGASTGGPLALVALLGGLTDVAAPVLVVQHIVAGFVDEFVNWLDGLVDMPVREATEGMRSQTGVAYFPPSGRHLTIDRRRVLHIPEHPVTLHRPSADVMLRSVAEAIGDRGIGVILTGMGDDGALGLLALAERGGVTVVQDEASSVIYGMAKAAEQIGAAQKVLPLGQIASLVRASVERIRV